MLFAFQVELIKVRAIGTYIIQLVLWIPIRLAFKFFYRYKVISEIDFSQLHGPYIVAANHGSYIDAFLLASAFPPRLGLYPFWFMTAPKFYFHPMLLPFFWLVGSFPVFKGMGMAKTLSFPLQILNSGGVVVIFPEGRRRKPTGRPPRARRGVAYLAAQTNVPIIPVWIDDILGLGVRDTIRRTRQITVRIGKPFTIDQSDVYDDTALAEISNNIMDRVWAMTK